MKIGFILMSVIAIPMILNSCKKDPAGTTQETPEQLLTKAEWKYDELRWSQVNTGGGGATYYYKRGVTANVGNLDNEKVVFATNNTGTHTIGSTISPLTWQFTNTEKTKLQFVITISPTNLQTVTWENIVMSATSIKFAEYFTTNTGITHIGSATKVH